MTDESGPKFKLPGDRPYSMIEDIPAFQDDDYLDALFESYLRTAAQRDAHLGGHLVEAAKEYVAPQSTPNPQTPSAPAQGRSGGPAREGTGYFCPEHEVEVRESKFADERYYHPLAEAEHYQDADGRTVKNCNLWLSQIVDEQGESLKRERGASA